MRALPHRPSLPLVNWAVAGSSSEAVLCDDREMVNGMMLAGRGSYLSWDHGARRPCGARRETGIANESEKNHGAYEYHVCGHAPRHVDVHALRHGDFAYGEIATETSSASRGGDVSGGLIVSRHRRLSCDACCDVCFRPPCDDVSGAYDLLRMIPLPP